MEEKMKELAEEYMAAYEKEVKDMHKAALEYEGEDIGVIHNLYLDNIAQDLKAIKYLLKSMVAGPKL